MPILKIRKPRLRKVSAPPAFSEQPKRKPRDVRLSPQVPSHCLSTFRLSRRKRRRASVRGWRSELSQLRAPRALHAAGPHASGPRLRARSRAVQPCRCVCHVDVATAVFGFRLGAEAFSVGSHVPARLLGGRKAAPILNRPVLQTSFNFYYSRESFPVIAR